MQLVRVAGSSCRKSTTRVRSPWKPSLYSLDHGCRPAERDSPRWEHCCIAPDANGWPHDSRPVQAMYQWPARRWVHLLQAFGRWAWPVSRAHPHCSPQRATQSETAKRRTLSTKETLSARISLPCSVCRAPVSRGSHTRSSHHSHNPLDFATSSVHSSSYPLLPYPHRPPPPQRAGIVC